MLCAKLEAHKREEGGKSFYETLARPTQHLFFGMVFVCEEQEVFIFFTHILHQVLA